MRVDAPADPAPLRPPSRLREPRGRCIASSQRRAGLGVWAATRSRAVRARVRRWKLAPPFDETELHEFATLLAGLVRQWSAVLPAGCVITCPPQGASAPGPYAAESLARAAAAILGVPFVQTLVRTDTKARHCVHLAMRQAPFVASLPDPPPTLTLVFDDLVTSGRTLKLSIAALNAAGVPAFGFTASGC